jgi:3',5'-cyclic AMP phosphodiesterase CpdA
MFIALPNRIPRNDILWSVPQGRGHIYAASTDSSRHDDAYGDDLTTSFTIAHLTDAHLPPAPWPPSDELALKRVLGFINWKRGRQRLTDAAMLERLTDDMRAQKPDHVAMTGDVVNLALRREFQAAGRWMESLGAAEDVSFVPGNHDAYVRQALPTLADTFAPWTGADAPGPDDRPFPYLRVRGEVALIGVRSGVPTALFMATGEVGANQLDALRALLADCRARGLIRVVMVHHAPIPGLPRMRGMVDAAAVAQVLAQEGAEIVLHGHHHKRMLHWISSEKTLALGGRIPVVGAPQASTSLKDDRHRAAYHLVSLTRREEGIAVSVRARGPDWKTGAIVELQAMV